jgi:hypothetical protein
MLAGLKEVAWLFLRINCSCLRGIFLPSVGHTIDGSSFEIFIKAITKYNQSHYNLLKSDPSLHKRYKAVKITIQLLASDPRHNSLQTHEFSSLKGLHGEKIFEAYAEQNTPAVYRVFWYYGPSKDQITIIAITRHP